MRHATHNSRDDISAFLGHKRIAAVGVSRNPQDFTRLLVRELIRRGYDIVPVNPGSTEMEGRPSYSAVSEIQPPVEAALLLTSPAATEEVVRDCASSGVGLVWMYRGGGTGAVSQAAVDFCREHGMRVIAGECPYMFLPKAGFPHRVHGLLRKIAGSYPS